jgi:putative oxygen-independent coproporphyrinogen III oxidase
MEGYAAACRREVLDNVGSGMPEATSVFFGGGTPSLLPARLLVEILEVIPRHSGAEVTVECNPDDVTSAQLGAYRAAGVTRLSFGVQSMVPHVLVGLGRSHDAAAVAAAVRIARDSGFSSFNLDLIFGAACETDEDWRRTLDSVFALGPPHVSAYALTVEPGTPLALDPARYPDDDVQAGRYLVADRLLEAAGLANYEISNWARPGYECRHNLLYWSQGDYCGIGCAAHSHRAGRRWWNVRTPQHYIALVGDGRSPEAGAEELDLQERATEARQLGLRTAAGLSVDQLGRSGLRELPGLIDLGLVAASGGRVKLTANGRLLANEVAVRLATG